MLKIGAQQVKLGGLQDRIPDDMQSPGSHQPRAEAPPRPPLGPWTSGAAQAAWGGALERLSNGVSRRTSTGSPRSGGAERGEGRHLAAVGQRRAAPNPDRLGAARPSTSRHERRRGRAAALLPHRGQGHGAAQRGQVHAGTRPRGTGTRRSTTNPMCTNHRIQTGDWVYWRDGLRLHGPHDSRHGPGVRLRSRWPSWRRASGRSG